MNLTRPRLSNFSKINNAGARYRKVKSSVRKTAMALVFAMSFATVASWLAVPSHALGRTETPPLKDFPKMNYANSVVDFGEIMSGGVPRDGIPAIDDPKFVSQQDAAEWLSPQEPVIALDIGGEARAYPLQILIWHEIVNDTLNGQAVSVTFCPLCNASIVFDRDLDGEALDFGTTGRLRRSDLVMYDRQSETWWQQITGRGLIGDYAGRTLVQVPSQIVSFQSFRDAYPAGQVLSKDTGHRRMYGRNPYRGYDDIDSIPFLYEDPVDPRLPAMERVANVSIGGSHRIYPFRAFEKEPVINDRVNGVPIVVFSKNDTVSALDGDVIADSKVIPSATVFRRQLDERLLTFEQRSDGLYDIETGSKWNLFGQALSGELAGARLPDAPHGIHFAFAWLAFHPESEIYGQ